ncbi:MAG: type ISP restriction/modification enzyme, partial [candidate division WOR-3 bacterium]
ADMYAQTICYGLFAAKCNTEPMEIFARETAADHLPNTNPFLRQLFHHIVGPNLDERVRWVVEQIVFLLNKADIGAILKDFGKSTRQEDPVVHFYETFLAQYDKKMRKKRGVYYTPEPVVSYIVRSVDHLVKEKFGKKDGLADPSVLILDPACGTGTFLYYVIRLIYERMAEKGQLGAWSGYVRNNLLNRIFGFELLMAPYAVAHLKLGLLLKETGYDFSGDERLGIYLTNTLEEAAKKSEILFAQWISNEANAATEIKRDKPIMVVLGNPPYSVESANRSFETVYLQRKGDSYLVPTDNFSAYPDGYKVQTAKPTQREKTSSGPLIRKTLTFIGRLIRSYFCVDGTSLNERNPKCLQDDYVKFIRWSQWRIEKTGYGIHAFITNNGYIDNPTFRGMRQQLMKVFDELYILDLHGSTKKKEKAPDGSRDENVFDIKQGVCIGIFARLPSSSKEKGKDESEQNALPRVFHSNLLGLRQVKYDFLSVHSVADTDWIELKPAKPYYLFVPSDIAQKIEYDKGWRIVEIMPVNSVGIATARDDLTISWTAEEAWKRIRDFARLSPEQVRDKYQLGSDTIDWKIIDAQTDIRKSGTNRSLIVPILYRPFDQRYTYYTGRSRGFICRPRYELMKHLLYPQNLAMCYLRRSREKVTAAFYVGRHPVDKSIVSAVDNAYIAPLYSYLQVKNNRQERWVFDTEASPWQPDAMGRVPNLNPEFVKAIERKLSLQFSSEQPATDMRQSSAVGLFGPEDTFAYIYAIFHSPTYRQRYAEFLKIDFPRVPITSDKELFWKLVALGRELVALHLLESPKVEEFVTRYPKTGTNIVEKVEYVYPSPSTSLAEDVKEFGRVYINSDQFFDGIKQDEWNFHIGGYQVLQKWLKDRKGRKLTIDAINHYQKIVVAIRETIKLMSEIDKAIRHWPVE